MSNDERVFKLLRPLNALDGSDVIELRWRVCDEWNDDKDMKKE